MKFYDSFDCIDGKSYIVVNNEIATEISQSFIDMTEYSMEELLNKNINELFSILRIGPSIEIKNVDGEKEYFLFTKSLDARFVNITVNEDTFKKVYVFSEKKNLRLDVKLPAVEALLSHDVLGIAIFSAPDITLLRANQTYLDFFDKPFNRRENSIGKKMHEIISGWIGSSSEDIWRNVLLTEKPAYIDEYMFKFERGVTYWEVSLAPVFENGIFKYCIEITTDITEKVLNRKKLEEQAKVIEQQNEQLKMQANLLNFSREAILAWRLDGDIIYWNKGAEEKYGYSKEEAIGYNGHELLKTIFPIDINKIKSILLREELWSGEIEHTRKDGSKLIVETRFQLIVDEKGHQTILETNRDITERKRIEEELRIQNQIIKQQKEQLEIIVENISEGLTVVDKNGNYIMLNKKVAKYTKNTTLLGRALEKVGESLEAGETYYTETGEIITLDDFPSMKVIRGEKVENQTVVVKHGDNNIYFNFNATPVFDEMGEVRLGIIICRDVTERVLYEKHIKEQKELLEKAMEMKDDFLSVISHEFRTPLNVINTAIQTLNFVYADQMTDKIKDYMRTIKQNTSRQLRLVNNLLDITRANAGSIKINKKNIDIVFLTKAITESVYEYASRKKVRITFVSKLAKKTIGIDDEKYERIILNLLSNAIKFTPAGKSIVVSMNSLKGNICVKVKDNGIGIPQDKIDIIFEKFGQVDSSLSRQAEGTGIGLSLVKKFVEALGGSITVESTFGKGTTFIILLPDEMALEEQNEKLMVDFMNDNRLVQITNVEFSDIYL
ncbi:PAS domain-containing protein [Clostridium chromiireducens]|uniref:histidine kinase n=1 Tax=Clostridium chromiireducens TaxID=225345 RepID=A0A399IRW0_9CLOT|nr:PAS domain-containing protein [Clostridium chromiireducens]RII33666.1 PAS domain-containing protein [Clostridium chromiireducens]